MKITLLAFRGTGGFRNPKRKDEKVLIKAGHVGIQFEGDTAVYGFHPTPQAAAEAGGDDNLVDLLKRHIAQDGYVDDDRDIFLRAYDLSQAGEQTLVWELTFDYPAEEFQEIYNKLLEWYNRKTIFTYNFPQEGGGFLPNEYNCASFPQLLGLTLPSDSGLLSEYVKAMEQAGATIWQPK